MDTLKSYKEQFGKSIEHLKQEIFRLRVGRATPALVEDLKVDAYGVKQPMKTLTSISVTDAKTLSIDPWDKGLIQAVELAIRNSNLGINPINDGKVIRLALPDLTQERREELIKVLNQKLEQTRVAIRKIREEARGKIDKKEKDKEISEDEKFKIQDELEKMVKEYNEKIKDVGQAKEVEINKI